MIDRVKRIEEKAIEATQKAKDLKELSEVRISFLGRKSELNQILRSIKDLPPQERPKVGKITNEVKTRIEKAIREREEELKKREERREAIDITLPGRRQWRGRPHPITQVTKEILDIFISMGFEEVVGPEIETEWYNFEALNIPPYHPARNMFASFYLNQNTLLRSHTSPVQIRVMEKRRPPLRIIAPGRVYRRDAFDTSHSPVFHQVEGLYVDKEVSFAELKGTLETFCSRMFGKGVKAKFIPSYFPFTEPSAEVAISCVICGGKGCSTCKGTGWIEILGCGMVHPKVFENVGYNPKRYTGYAFGMGVERIAMIKYRIDDIRLFYENDIRFLRQF